MPSPGEFPSGVYPIYEGDNITTIVTGLFANRIRRAEEIGLFEPGTTELYLSEIDSAATDEARIEIQNCWDEKCTSWANMLNEAATRKAEENIKTILGNDDFEIPDEEL